MVAFYFSCVENCFSWIKNVLMYALNLYIIDVLPYYFFAYGRVVVLFDWNF